MEPAIGIDILVGDDHHIIYQGIEAMLSRSNGIGRLDHSSSADSIQQCLLNTHYDLLILDLNLAGTNSLDHVEHFRTIDKNLKIIIFSSYNNKKLIAKARQLEVNGYLLKSTDEATFNEAIVSVMQGESYFLADGAEDEKLDEPALMHITELSTREKELASLIVAGNNEQELAELLFISKNTVRTHKKNIFRKLNVSGTFGLIKYINANSEVF